MKGWESKERTLHVPTVSHRRLELTLSRKSSNKVSLGNFTDRDFVSASLGKGDHLKTESHNYIMTLQGEDFSDMEQNLAPIIDVKENLQMQEHEVSLQEADSKNLENQEYPP